MAARIIPVAALCQSAISHKRAKTAPVFESSGTWLPLDRMGKEWPNRPFFKQEFYMANAPDFNSNAGNEPKQPKPEKPEQPIKCPKPPVQPKPRPRPPGHCPACGMG